jgi:hypothetical protein
MRAGAIELRAETDETSYKKKVNLTKEIAEVLRRNVVQAVKVKKALNEGEEEIWSKRPLRLRG